MLFRRSAEWGPRGRNRTQRIRCGIGPGCLRLHLRAAAPAPIATTAQAPAQGRPPRKIPTMAKKPCVFRPNRTPIPGEAEHPFRAKPNTQTGQGEHPGA